MAPDPKPDRRTDEPEPVNPQVGPDQHPANPAQDDQDDQNQRDQREKRERERAAR